LFCRISGNSFSNSPAPTSDTPPPLRPSPTGVPSHNNKSPSRGSNTDNGGAGTGSSTNGGHRSSKVGGGTVAGIVISLVVAGALVAFFVIKRKSARRQLGDDPEKNVHLSPIASGKIKRKSILAPTTRKFKQFCCLSSLNNDFCSELRPIHSVSLSPTGKETLHKTLSMNLRPPSKIDLHKSSDENDPASKHVVKEINMSSIRATVYTVADLQVATESFSADNLIGEGSFARVYRAQLPDQKVCW
jgi:hypothetical protein